MLDLLKYMDDEEKITQEDIEEWNKLSGKEAFDLLYDNVTELKELIYDDRKFNNQEKSNYVAMMSGLVHDLKQHGFDIKKVLEYCDEVNKKREMRHKVGGLLKAMPSDRIFGFLKVYAESGRRKEDFLNDFTDYYYSRKPTRNGCRKVTYNSFKMFLFEEYNLKQYGQTLKDICDYYDK